MFKIKFGTSKTIDASSVDERFMPATEQIEGGYTLTIEVPSTTKSIEELVALVTETGATDTIEVSVEGSTVATYTNYTSLDDLSVRLLATGDRLATIRLGKRE